MAFLVHQPLLSHCPARVESLSGLSSIPPARPGIDILCYHFSKAMPTPISAVSSMFLRSIRTTLPFFIRANCPYCSAKSLVRGKFSSTIFPDLRGAVSGILTKTPVLLTLQLRPLKNLLASGSHTLTGHARVFRISLRCSAVACIVMISINITIPSLLILSAMLKWVD